jgi:putative spermidine/putrescine transport system substrate-binding protein
MRKRLTAECEVGHIGVGKHQTESADGDRTEGPAVNMWPQTVAPSVVAVLALSACASGVSGDRATEMNMCNFSGALGEEIQSIAAEFEEEKNVRINWCTGTGSGADNTAKVKASKGRQIYDAVLVDIQSQNLGSKEGLWAELDKEIVDTSKVYDELIPPSEDSVPIGMISTNLFYRPSAMDSGAAPSSYSDLLNSDYCGRAGILASEQSYGLYTVLGFGGLTREEAEAGQLDRAWDDGLSKLEEAKDCFPSIETSGGSLEQKIQTGDYEVGAHGSVRILPLMDAGTPIESVVPEEGPFLVASYIAPVEGAPNPELAQEFANWFLRPEAQERLMNSVFYGPVTEEVDVPVELSESGVLTRNDIPSLVIPDVSTVTEKRAEWNEEFRRRMG